MFLVHEACIGAAADLFRRVTRTPATPATPATRSPRRASRLTSWHKIRSSWSGGHRPAPQCTRRGRGRTLTVAPFNDVLTPRLLVSNLGLRSRRPQVRILSGAPLHSG